MIDHFTGKYEFLSNFYPSPIEVRLPGGLVKTAPTVEHAFQSYKTGAPMVRIRILEAATPGLARKIGRRVHPDDRWEWEQYNVMFRLLKIKFSNPDLRDKLLATGDEYLVFSNDWHDTIWGVCKCGFCPGGRNALGKLLMKLRKELKCHTNTASATSVDQSSRKKNTGKPASASTGKSSDCGSG